MCIIIIIVLHKTRKTFFCRSSNEKCILKSQYRDYIGTSSELKKVRVPLIYYYTA